jgi:ribosomal protein S6--L-glutamate ligase
MKIGIISADNKSYSTQRLKDTITNRGHTARVISPHSFSIHIEQDKPELYLRGKPIGKLDAIIPRIESSQNAYGISVIRQFEQMGVFSLNQSHAINIARDKLRTMQTLSRHHIGIPATACVLDHAEISNTVSRIGNAPVIIKLLQGSQGAGVMLAETNKVAQAIIESLQTVRETVLIQKFVSESKGTDIRAFVVGDRVVAAMRRIAQDEDFRSNVHLGGKTEKVILDSNYERSAIRAVHVLGLRVAGVDLLESSSGPLVMEVNASPGLEGIEKATDIDVAGAIIEYLEEQVLFPDIDLRERLALSKGYSVAEIVVSRKSELARKTIAEMEFHQLGIQVLTLIRNGLAMPMPSQSERIQLGDTLICFGKQISLKSLLPPKGTRTRKVQALNPPTDSAAHKQ